MVLRPGRRLWTNKQNSAHAISSQLMLLKIPGLLSAEDVHLKTVLLQESNS